VIYKVEGRKTLADEIEEVRTKAKAKKVYQDVRELVEQFR